MAAPSWCLLLLCHCCQNAFFAGFHVEKGRLAAEEAKEEGGGLTFHHDWRQIIAKSFSLVVIGLSGDIASMSNSQLLHCAREALGPFLAGSKG